MSDFYEGENTNKKQSGDQSRSLEQDRLSAQPQPPLQIFQEKSEKAKKTISPAAKRGLFILLLLAGIGLVTIFLQDFIFSQNQTSLPRGSFSYNRPNKFSLSFNGSNYLAILYIEGTIEEANKTYNQNWLLDTIDTLARDDKNCGILLYINSPGGGVYQSDDLYLALRDYTEKNKKPLWAYMGQLAASGGYYVACAADTIYANRNTLTGSIGVIAGTSIDISSLLNKYGIKIETITAGKNKNMGGINNPLTKEQRAIMQSIADEAYEQFTQIVAESRSMNIGAVQKLADGRIYTAAQAREKGLIDYIDSFENTVNDMLTDFFSDIDVKVKHFRFESKKTFSDYLYNASSLFLKSVPAELQALRILKDEIGLPENLVYPAYYYQPDF